MNSSARALRLALAVSLWAVSASACSEDVGKTFPDRDVAQFVSCANSYDVQDCRLDRDKMNYHGKDGWTPLLWLLAKERISPGKMVSLIKAGADPHQPSSPTAAGFAIRNMPIEYLKALVESGLDINSVPRKGEDRGWDYSFIFSAILSRDFEKVKYLVDNGANLEIKDNLGRTPILAADVNQFDVQILLLEHGADPTVVDKRGLGICYPIETLPFEPTEDMQKLLEMLKRRGIVCRPRTSHSALG